MEKIKRCINCGRFLGENSFHWQNKGKGYRQSICRRCTKIYGKEYCQENKEKQRDQKKKYYNENKKYILKRSKKWQNENKDKIKKWCDINKDRIKEWRNENKDRINKRQKKYREKNNDKMRKAEREYYQNHRDKRKEHVQKYRIKNRDRVRAIAGKRRSIKLNAIPDDVDMKKVNYIYSFCNKLNEIYGYIKYHVDHIKPISKGGLHHENNLQVLEAKLNEEKASSYPFEKRFEGIMYKNLEVCNYLIKILKSQRIKNMSVPM